MSVVVRSLELMRLRIENSIRVHGVLGTAKRIVLLPFRTLVSLGKRRKIFSNDDTTEIFRRIYETNWWGSDESVSGTGSTIAYTGNLRNKLPTLLNDLSVSRVLDAPCGDFNWMSHVTRSRIIDYVGCDIVPELVYRNKERYEDKRTQFMVLDVIRDALPPADLWICRDCLIHFSFRDILATFENFARSDIEYMLTTTHINSVGFKNIDIRTGDARNIDLFSPPFSLPTNYINAIEDWHEPDVPRMLILIRRNEIASILPAMRDRIKRVGKRG